MALYTYTIEDKQYKAVGVKALQQSLKDNLRAMQFVRDWDALAKLPVGASFYLADAERFGVTVKVDVTSPTSVGVMVFSGGKIL